MVTLLMTLLRVLITLTKTTHALPSNSAPWEQPRSSAQGLFPLILIRGP